MSLNFSIFASIGLTLGLSLVPSTANAQLNNFNQSEIQNSPEARISFAIPFGAERKDYKSKPRLALSVRQYNQNPTSKIDWALRPDEQYSYFETELAVSLSKDPTFSLNGQVLNFERYDSTDLSTGETIIVTLVGVTVVVLGAGFIIANDIEEGLE